MKRRNPVVKDWTQARKAAAAMSKSSGALMVARKVPGGYEIGPAKSAPAAAAKNRNRGRRLGSAGYYKGKAFSRRMEKMRRRAAQGGRGRMLNAKGVSSARIAALKKARRANPARWRRNAPEVGGFIGSAPSLKIQGQGFVHFPRGVLRTGADPRSVYLVLGGSPAPKIGARVTRVEYNDPEKAIEAYGSPGRFFHDCEEPFVVSAVNGGTAVLSTKSATAWKKE